MDATRRELIMQRWKVVQHELIPELNNDIGTLMPTLEKVIRILKWGYIKKSTGRCPCVR